MGLEKDTPNIRDVTIRDGPDERVFVWWSVGLSGSSFVQILSDRDGDEILIAGLHPDDLTQLLAALDPENHTEMVRDMGRFQRVVVDRSEGYVSLAVEQNGEIDRMLVLDESETEKLREAIERAENELPRTEEDAHV